MKHVFSVLTWADETMNHLLLLRFHWLKLSPLPDPKRTVPVRTSILPDGVFHCSLRTHTPTHIYTHALYYTHMFVWEAHFSDKISHRSFMCFWSTKKRKISADWLGCLSSYRLRSLILLNVSFGKMPVVSSNYWALILKSFRPQTKTQTSKAPHQFSSYTLYSNALLTRHIFLNTHCSTSHIAVVEVVVTCWVQYSILTKHEMLKVKNTWMKT